MIEQGGLQQGLFIADKEHFTKDVSEYFCKHPALDILMPAPDISKVKQQITSLSYTPLWAGSQP